MGRTRKRMAFETIIIYKTNFMWKGAKNVHLGQKQVKGLTLRRYVTLLPREILGCLCWGGGMKMWKLGQTICLSPSFCALFPSSFLFPVLYFASVLFPYFPFSPSIPPSLLPLSFQLFKRRGTLHLVRDFLGREGRWKFWSLTHMYRYTTSVFWQRLGGVFKLTRAQIYIVRRMLLLSELFFMWQGSPIGALLPNLFKSSYTL